MDNDLQSKKESLLSTKQLSSIPKVKSSLTLDEVKRSPAQFAYYYQSEEEIIPIKIPTRVITVRDAIEQGIEVLNQDFGFDLLNDYQKFNLYAAKKTGKKKSDLPSLDYGQEIEKTKFEGFVIIPKLDAVFNNTRKTNSNVNPLTNKKPIVPLENPQPPPSLQVKHTSKREIASDFGYYPTNTEIVPLTRGRKQTPPDVSVGCFCFRKKS